MKSLVLMMVAFIALTTASGCSGETKPTVIGSDLTNAQVAEYAAMQEKQEQETSNSAKEDSTDE